MWVSGICMLGPWPTSHQGLSGHQDSSDRALFSCPWTCPSQIPGTDIGDAHPSPSPYNTTVFLITQQTSRDRRGVLSWVQAAWNPRKFQEVTEEEEQSPCNKTLKTDKARALKTLLEHCEWKLQDFGSRWLHTYRTYVCLDAPHFQPVCSDTVAAF